MIGDFADGLYALAVCALVSLFWLPAPRKVLTGAPAVAAAD
jgi:hypothetical protein